MKPIPVSHPPVPVPNVGAQAHVPHQVRGGSTTDPAGEPFKIAGDSEPAAASASPGRSAESPAHRARAFGALAASLDAGAPFGQLVKLFAQGLVDLSTADEGAPDDGGDTNGEAVAPAPETDDQAAAGQEDAAPEAGNTASETAGDDLDLGPVVDGSDAEAAAEAALLEALSSAERDDQEPAPTVA